MLEPVLSRAFDPFEPLMAGVPGPTIDRAWWIFFVVGWNGFFLSLIACDRIVDRRVHPVTVAGLCWFYTAWAIALLS
jgi:hypothetical protein